MAFDAARGTVLMFGGASATGDVADTWEWDGTSWTQLFPVTSPPARRFGRMFYDEARGRILLFGGCCSPLLNDTWEWDGGQANPTWTELHPATSPPWRPTTAMTYDSARGRVVLFGGGANETGYLNDTWEWNGTVWTEIDPAKSPSTRGYTSMAYDAARRQTVLFGGYSGTGGCCLFGETWLYEGVTAN
jgi:hypothetical protein